MKKTVRMMCVLFVVILLVLPMTLVMASAQTQAVEKPVWTTIGDGNRDGKIDAKDALYVLIIRVVKMPPKYFVPKFLGYSMDQLTEEQAYYCYRGAHYAWDVNKDDFLDAQDALMILQYAVAKRDSFPRTDLSDIDSLVWDEVTPTNL